jgi:hypothetical protein
VSTAALAQIRVRARCARWLWIKWLDFRTEVAAVPGAQAQGGFGLGSRMMQLFSMILPTRAQRSVIFHFRGCRCSTEMNRQDHLGPAEFSGPFLSMSAHMFLPSASKGNA